MDLSLRRAYNFVAVTPSDTVYIVPTADGSDGAPIAGFYVGTSAPSDVTCINESGTAVTFKNCLQGTYYPFSTRRINATGTTASNIVALM